MLQAVPADKLPSLAADGGVVLETPYILGILAASGGVIAFLFRQLISAKDLQYASLLEGKDKVIAELTGQKLDWQKAAEASGKALLDTTNFYRTKYENRPPIVPLVPVIPDSHSPSTPIQRERAAMETLRATLAQVNLESGREPEAHPPEGGPRPPTEVPLASSEPPLAEAKGRAIEAVIVDQAKPIKVEIVPEIGEAK